MLRVWPRRCHFRHSRVLSHFRFGIRFRTRFRFRCAERKQISIWPEWRCAFGLSELPSSKLRRLQVRTLRAAETGSRFGGAKRRPKGLSARESKADKHKRADGVSLFCFVAVCRCCVLSRSAGLLRISSGGSPAATNANTAVNGPFNPSACGLRDATPDPVALDRSPISAEANQ